MDGDLAPFSEPIASTSRAVYTLAYKEDDEGQQPAEDFTDAANLELYEQAWNACNAQIQTTLSSLHDASLDQIVSFVHASADTAGSLYSALSGRVPLPTGLIVGAYPGSSSLLYSSLIRLLTRPSSSSNPAAQAPCIVSRVSSRDCSNIKNALRSVIGGFVGSAANVEIEDDDEEEEMEVASGPATLKSALIVPEDMLNLKAWYEHRYGKKDSESAPNLAVLLEDLEAMDGKVLTQLLETLSLYTSTLPLVLLVGVATTADALYNLVPRRTCNKLDAQSFFVDPGVGAFNALVRGVFVDSLPPLQLGPKAYNDMWRTFEDLHHSIDATISFIQYLYMNHFTSSPLSPLTLPPSPSFSPSAIAETLRSLPSVTSSTSPLAAPLVDPSATSSSILDSVSAARTSLAAWHASRSVAFEALLACMEFWERRKPMEVCLGMVLGEHSAQMAKTVDDLAGLVLQASSAKLPNFLRHLTSRLSSFAPASPLLAFLEAQLSALQPILDAPRPAGRANLVNSNLAGSLLALPAGFPAAAGQAGLTQADKDFSRLAKETAEGLKARLKDALKPCTELFLHEIWFSNDSSAMKRFHPAPPPSLFRTLQKADPFSDPSYIPSSPSADPLAEPEPVPLDLAVAYRTYAETHPAGRLTNLGEWWAAFELQAADEPEEGMGAGGTNGQGKGKGKKRARDDDEEDEEESEEEDEDEGPQRRKQARFLRAVGALAHLGFIHPSTYKPEHVLKSVY